MSKPVHIISDDIDNPQRGFTVDGVGDEDQYENCQALFDLELALDRHNADPGPRPFSLRLFEIYLSYYGEIRYVDYPGQAVPVEQDEYIIDGMYMWEPFSQDNEQLLIPFSVISNRVRKEYKVICHRNWDMDGHPWFLQTFALTNVVGPTTEEDEDSVVAMIAANDPHVGVDHGNMDVDLLIGNDGYDTEGP